jgi:type VI secretion system protein ImpL
LVVEFGGLCLIWLVWFLGPSIGLESVESRIQVIIAIGLLRFMLFVAEHLVSQRRAAQLEASLQQQAQVQMAAARPDHKDELEALRRQFDKGIAALKESNIGKGVKGKAALYALPWYMFIGPPASGKSTALRHSGLQFPYLGESGQGLQGMGGTRNCDWWFTNDAVLLDTAGRYVSHEEDQKEWLGFLDLLKRCRKDKPINGILVAISIADLMQASDEELDSHAKKIRSRIDELIKHLGINFPIYLIFTKCDLVRGFVEFFDELTKPEREKIWGCTFPKSSAKDPAHVRFRADFDQLVASLDARRMARLVNARGPHKLNAFTFPLQLASSADKLTRFVEILFQTNPYQENPMFRGFYLTSGTQEGAPIDRILGAISRASGLGEMVGSILAPPETKSYFLKDLFTEVIFPDQFLAGPSSIIHKQRGFLRVASFAAATVFIVVSVLALAFSYVGNKALISSTLSASLNAPDIALTDAATLEQNLQYLDRLGERSEELLSYANHGVPIRLWGFYRGDRLLDNLQEVYVRQFEKVFLIPTKQAMEDELYQFTAGEVPKDATHSSDYYYSMLKAYIMLGEPKRVTTAYLERWLNAHWNRRLSGFYATYAVPDWVQASLKRHMALYAEFLARSQQGRVELNKHLVANVQEHLRDIPLVERLYGLTLRELDESVRPFSVETVLQGTHQGSIISEYLVPGIFTYEGWKGSFQTAMSRVLEGLGSEAWVVGEPDTKQSDLARGIKKLYFQDYVLHWRAFLKSLKLGPAVTPVNMEELLSTLSQTDSPFLRVLEAVDRNTVPESEGITKLQETAAGLLGKMKEKLGLESVGKKFEKNRRDPDSAEFPGGVTVHFLALHNLITPPKEGQDEPPFNQYLAELRKAHQALRPVLRSETVGADTKTLAKTIVAGETNELLQGVHKTDGLLQRFDTELRESMVAVLSEPWLMTMRGVLERTRSDIDRRWGADVFQACQRTIEGRFPFRPSGEDAVVADVVDFFHPQNGTLWRFHQAELKPFIEETGDRLVRRSWHGVAMNFSDDFMEALERAKFISDGLFTRGSPDLGSIVEVYPYPPQGLAGRNVTEVRLDIGGQRLGYRMEPQEWWEMKWPGPTPSAGAGLLVQVGNTWVTREYKDVWGLFKLIKAGFVEATDHSEVMIKVKWDIQSPDTKPLQVQYDVKGRSARNPFRPGFFERFNCMQHLS